METNALKSVKLSPCKTKSVFDWLALESCLEDGRSVAQRQCDADNKLSNAIGLAPGGQRHRESAMQTVDQRFREAAGVHAEANGRA